MSTSIHGPGPGDPAQVDAILRALPEWFGIEDSIRAYVAEAPSLDTWTAQRDDALLGFVCIKRHFPHAAEILVMGVVPDAHRQGIGASLLDAAESTLAAGGVTVLQVKTLSPSHPDVHYALTRAFYEARGFEPFEDLPTLWGEANPCRVYFKLLD
jgi:GNAT superfamily N-acetyltransferase